MKAITFLMLISTINYCYSTGNSFFSLPETHNEKEKKEYQDRISNCHVLAAKFKRPILTNKNNIVQGIIVLLATDQEKTEKNDPLHLVSNTRYMKEELKTVGALDTSGEEKTSSSLQNIFDETSKRDNVYLVRIGALYHSNLAKSSLIDLTEQDMTDKNLFHEHLPTEWEKNKTLKALYDRHRSLVKNCIAHWDTSDKIICRENGFNQKEFELLAVLNSKNPRYFDGDFLNLPDTLLGADGEIDKKKEEEKRQREEDVRKEMGSVSK